MFPIVTKAGCTGDKLYSHIRSRYHTCNDHLKELAKEFGITDMPLTTYVSRHTMAMTLRENNVLTDIIQQVLGHNDTKTTQTYLDSFNTDVISKATKVL